MLLFIVPAAELVNSHMDSYVFAKAVKHTRVRLRALQLPCETFACAQDLFGSVDLESWALFFPFPTKHNGLYVRSIVHAQPLLFNLLSSAIKRFSSFPADDGLQNGPGLHRNSQGKQRTLQKIIWPLRNLLYCMHLCFWNDNVVKLSGRTQIALNVI